MLGIESVDITDDAAEMVDSITTCCPATCFYAANGMMLVLADDATWIARVYPDGGVDTAYLSQEPIETLVSVKEDTFTVNDLPELQGFTPGWEC